MKLKTTIIILALSAAPAFAFDADHSAKSKTREEVKAELSQALRSGVIVFFAQIDTVAADPIANCLERYPGRWGFPPHLTRVN